MALTSEPESRSGRWSRSRLLKLGALALVAAVPVLLIAWSLQSTYGRTEIDLATGHKLESVWLAGYQIWTSSASPILTATDWPRVDASPGWRKVRQYKRPWRGLSHYHQSDLTVLLTSLAQTETYLLNNSASAEDRATVIAMLIEWARDGNPALVGRPDGDRNELHAYFLHGEPVKLWPR
ncbi:MAG: hypothetical protein JJU33_05445 [Phycisphaerales bacterium]|nr:hypothetical protein [Phycisphaerales bacterium]